MTLLATGRRAQVFGLGLALALAATPASAHPHVWVTTHTTVLFKNGAIVGFEHKWTFDQYYSSMATEGLDANKDGVLSREELAELAKVNMAGLKEFGYFTFPKLSGQAIQLAAPGEGYLEYAEAPADAPGLLTGQSSAPPPGSPPPTSTGVMSTVRGWLGGAKDAKDQKPARPKLLTLTFTLPLAQPVLAEAKGFTFVVADPSFFIAFEPAAKDAVRLGPGAPQGCRIEIGKADRSQDDASRLGEAFANQLGAQSLGYSFAKTVSLSCTPKS